MNSMTKLLFRELEEKESLPWDLLLLADPSKGMIEEYLGKGKTFVVELNKQISGVMVLLPTRPFTIEIINIAVDETKQGIGIGKKLIYYAIDYGKKHGYKRIEIGTGNSSIGQLALYQKCGFRIDGIDRDYFIRNYPEKIEENGIACVDMVRLSMEL